MNEKAEGRQWVGLVISPNGCLHLEEHPETEPANAVSPILAEKIQTLFTKDSLQGVLHLGLTPLDSGLPPSVAFWREFSNACSTGVVNWRAPVQKTMNFGKMPPPVTELQTLLGQAPVMPGVEYLNLERLCEWWQSLLKQLIQEVDDFNPPRLSAYLEAHHLSWNKVGRVCFHLAENKTDSEHPFAFLAIYAARLSKTTAVQHGPLGRALQEIPANPVAHNCWRCYYLSKKPLRFAFY